MCISPVSRTSKHSLTFYMSISNSLKALHTSIYEEGSFSMYIVRVEDLYTYTALAYAIFV